uniref:Uncharacterized protein n=1 Tax=Trichogramma kaykai TaxID=54128 RepID=A0ABD2W773_9HYME
MYRLSSSCELVDSLNEYRPKIITRAKERGIKLAKMRNAARSQPGSTTFPDPTIGTRVERSHEARGERSAKQLARS